MPVRQKHSRRRNRTLTTAQRWDLELGIVPSREAFASEREAREAWDSVRDEYVGRYIDRHHGKRPWAWWVFDRNLDRPTESETDRLFAMGEMSAAEIEGVRRGYASLPRAMWPDCISG